MSNRRERKTFDITSSGGYLEADVETGEVIAYTISDDSYQESLGNIKKFNVEEWKEYYPLEVLLGKTVDILDLGYWMKDGSYEAAVQDWRDEFRKERRNS